ncbi:MAG TPA: ATP-binding protein [Candidatus Eisenbacteria bacterium]|nr:ATP-binding protein [Candidatus Eisenbacteria bacterium]
MTSRPEPARQRRPGFESRILLLGFLSGLPGTVLAMALLWTSDLPPRIQWSLTALVGFFWCALVLRLRDRVVRPIQTLSNMMAALLEGDYSIRTRDTRSEDALGLAFRELNALGQTLREHRLGALDATALLRKVMEEIDAAVFVFDEERRLRLVNRAGERLLGIPSERILGLDAPSLGLEECLDGQGARTTDARFPGRAGRWEVRATEFRQGGLPHRLLVLTDLSRALREEERQAWQRLVRVLGHEINNSLTPIVSIAGSLRDRLARGRRRDELDEDMDHGLEVIVGRTEALRRFLSAHARLARLPAPKMGSVSVEAWVRRAAALETRRSVEVVPGRDVVIQADGDQLDQLLINLIRNATEAALETDGGVRVGWDREGPAVEVRVEDEGPGIPDTANLFVPFFTTKPQGTGIGLVLSRQIAEAHGGSVVLENRPGGGCVARLRVPVGSGVAPRPS